MRTAGALIASIGTSAILVAAVTLSLLSFSAVFALGGFEGSRDASSAEATVLDLETHAKSGSPSAVKSKQAAVAVVDRLPARSATRAHRPARHRDTARSAASTASVSGDTSSAAALSEGSAGQPPEQQPSAPAPARRSPNLGDGVRQLGDGVSSSVRQTGTELSKATAPLGQPVSAAVAQVLTLVAAVIKGTTDALGGVLGAQP